MSWPRALSLACWASRCLSLSTLPRYALPRGLVSVLAQLVSREGKEQPPSEPKIRGRRVAEGASRRHPGDGNLRPVQRATWRGTAPPASRRSSLRSSCFSRATNRPASVQKRPSTGWCWVSSMPCDRPLDAPLQAPKQRAVDDQKSSAPSFRQEKVHRAGDNVVDLPCIRLHTPQAAYACFSFDAHGEGQRSGFKLTDTHARRIAATCSC